MRIAANRHGYINSRKERRERKGKASIFMKFHVFHGSGLFNAETQRFFGGSLLLRPPSGRNDECKSGREDGRRARTGHAIGSARG